MPNKEKATGRCVHKRDIEFIRCVEGHLAPFEMKDILSEHGVSCPVCNTPITLSKSDLQILLGTRGIEI